MSNVSSSNSQGELVPELRFPEFSGEWKAERLSDFATRVTRKNSKNESILPLTISSKDGLVDQISYFNKTVASKDLSGYYLLKKGEYAYNKSYSVGYNWRSIKRLERYDMGALSTLYICFSLKNHNSNFINTYFHSLCWYREVQSIAAEGARNHGLLNIPTKDFFETKHILPNNIKEQEKIAQFFELITQRIRLHEKLLDSLKSYKRGLLSRLFPKKGYTVPELRFKDFTNDWEQRKFGEQYKKVTEKNDLNFGTDKIISVANMYFKKDDSKSDDDYMKTYNIMRLGDIAFEGNKSKNYAHGRFVENTIGDGIVSHVFDVFRPISEYDLLFWKYLINYEGVMGRIMARCTKASTMMTNLVALDFLKESILVPSVKEQKKIGGYLAELDHLITLHRQKLNMCTIVKKYLLQKMFV